MSASRGDGRLQRAKMRLEDVAADRVRLRTYLHPPPTATHTNFLFCLSSAPALLTAICSPAACCRGCGSGALSCCWNKLLRRWLLLRSTMSAAGVLALKSVCGALLLLAIELLSALFYTLTSLARPPRVLSLFATRAGPRAGCTFAPACAAHVCSGNNSAGSNDGGSSYGALLNGQFHELPGCVADAGADS